MSKKFMKRITNGSSDYLFNGDSLKIFKITNEDELQEYMENYGKVDGEGDLATGKTDSLGKIVLNVSNQCNLRCLYCYADGGKYKHKMNHEMTVETLKDIVLSVKEKGIKDIAVVSFFGGEPLLNMAVVEEGLKQFSRFFNINTFEIVTNGTLVTAEILELFKSYNVKLSISIDGPENITDELRGKGTFASAQEALLLAKNMAYNNLWISATYTKRHEEMGYTWNDIENYFKQYGAKLSLSRVLTDDDKLIPTKSPSLEKFRQNIDDSLHAILKNDTASSINPYLYDILMALIFSTKHKNFCNDLYTNISISYDYNGDIYNCFRIWGEEEFKIDEGTAINETLEKWNSKEAHTVCANCWARDICHLCSVAVMQGVFSYGFNEQGECVNEKMYGEVLERVVNYIESGDIAAIANNFSTSFKIY